MLVFYIHKTCIYIQAPLQLQREKKCKWKNKKAKIEDTSSNTKTTAENLSNKNYENFQLLKTLENIDYCWEVRLYFTSPALILGTFSPNTFSCLRRNISSALQQAYTHAFPGTSQQLPAIRIFLA